MYSSTYNYFTRQHLGKFSLFNNLGPKSVIILFTLVMALISPHISPHSAIVVASPNPQDDNRLLSISTDNDKVSVVETSIPDDLLGTGNPNGQIKRLRSDDENDKKGPNQNDGDDPVRRRKDGENNQSDNKGEPSPSPKPGDINNSSSSSSTPSTTTTTTTSSSPEETFTPVPDNIPPIVDNDPDKFSTVPNVKTTIRTPNSNRLATAVPDSSQALSTSSRSTGSTSPALYIGLSSAGLALVALVFGVWMFRKGAVRPSSQFKSRYDPNSISNRNGPEGRDREQDKTFAAQLRHD